MHKKNTGAVLLIVLLVLIALIIIVFAYVDSITIDSMISSNQKNEVTTFWAARGGIELSKAYLVLDDEREFDSLNEPWAQEIKKNELGEADVEVVAVDEDRKFNILACIDGNDDQKKAATDILERLIEYARDEENTKLKSGELEADELVENIVEWLEERSGSNQEGTLSEIPPSLGANEDYDNLLGDDRKINKSSPYAILTIAELLMVEGVTRSLLYGPPQKILEKQEEEEDEFDYDDDFDEEDRKPLLDFITCYSTNIRKINVNTAPYEVLMSLSENMPTEIVDAIIDVRVESEEDIEDSESEEEDEDTASFRNNDIASKSNFSKKIDLEIDDVYWNDIKGWLAVRSEYFSVVATAYGKSGNRKSRLKQTWRAFMKRVQRNNTYSLELMIIDREN